MIDTIININLYHDRLLRCCCRCLITIGDITSYLLPAESALPFLLLLVHADSPGTQSHHHEQSPDDGEGLEEVVLEEISGQASVVDGPEVVEPEIHQCQPRA